MTTTNLNIHTDKAIKQQAEEIFNELGLNMTIAVNRFLRTAIRKHDIPFSPFKEYHLLHYFQLLCQGELLHFLQSIRRCQYESAL